MDGLGRTLIGLGLAIAALGLLVVIAAKVPGLRFGRLPGDVSVQKDGFAFFFPITTMLLLSAIASLALWLFGRWRR